MHRLGFTITSICRPEHPALSGTVQQFDNCQIVETTPSSELIQVNIRPQAHEASTSDSQIDYSSYDNTSGFSFL